MTQINTTGTLFLIPSFLGEQSAALVFPTYNSEIIKSLQYFIVENIRTSRRALKQIEPTIDIDSITFFELNKHCPDAEIAKFIEPAKKGFNIGVMSEAGMPCIADPGNLIVSLAHKNNIKVCPLVGPSSILLALISSGFNGQNFTFNGYIPIKENRKQALLQFEALARKNCTQIFMETPYRNNSLLEDLFAILHPNTKLCIACDVTTHTEFIKTLTIADWKKQNIDLNKRPCIFLIGI